MSSLKTYPLLLLILPLLLVCSPVSSEDKRAGAYRARRVLKGGCLNYGHSCLGAHGKRASWNPDVQLTAPANQPTLPRPLLNILLDALSVRPDALANLRNTKDASTQSSDAFPRGVKFNSGRMMNSPSFHDDDDDSMGKVLIPDEVMGILNSRMNRGNFQFNDRLDDDTRGDALYFVNMDEYADDRIRRSAVENAPITTKEGKKESNQEWKNKGKESDDHHKERQDNIDLRLYANWLKR